MRVLTLDSALAHVSVGLVEDDRVVAEHSLAIERGQPGRLAVLAQQILTGNRWAGPDRCLGVTVGPGGFTGIRAALALAHGLAMGAGVSVIGVTVGEALAAGRTGGDRGTAWTAIDSRRGRIFLEVAGDVRSVGLTELPHVPGPIEILGDAAEAVVAALRAGGTAVTVGARWPEPRGIARAALARSRGELPPRSAQPLYVDPPAVRMPAGGLRPTPAP